MTAAAKSPECSLGEHPLCVGSRSFKRPGARQWEAPVMTVSCDCICHRKGKPDRASQSRSTPVKTCAHCDKPITDPDDAVYVGHEGADRGPGWDIWAHREHVDLLRPDTAAMNILARVLIAQALRADDEANVMICARCDKPIRPGQAQAIDHDAPSGAGLTMYFHPYLCRRPQTQTSPSPGRRAIREG